MTPAVPLGRLTVAPITMARANRFIAKYHRHHKPVRGCLFCICVVDPQLSIHGVAIVGRPVARALDNGFTAEVTRLATKGTPNACSMLYGAAWRAARAIGYRKMVTYTLATELGTSLRASGWQRAASVYPKSWSLDNPTSLPRPRVDKHPLVPKVRWEVGCK